MTDPDDQKTVQQAIENITNLSPNELRERLGAFATNIASTQILAPRQVDAPDPPQITETVQSFDTRPIVTTTNRPPFIPPNLNDTNLPFKIFMRSNSGTAQWGLSDFTGIYNSRAPGTLVVPTGILNSDHTSGWINLAFPDEMVVVGTMATGASFPTITALAVQTTGTGGTVDPWVEFDDPGAPPVPQQTFFRLRVGRNFATSGSPKIIQDCAMAGHILLVGPDTAYRSDGSDPTIVLAGFPVPM